MEKVKQEIAQILSESNVEVNETLKTFLREVFKKVSNALKDCGATQIRQSTNKQHRDLEFRFDFEPYNKIDDSKYWEALSNRLGRKVERNKNYPLKKIDGGYYIAFELDEDHASVFIGKENRPEALDDA